MFTQVVSGHIPLLLHGHAEETLVIGLGSGVTAHAASLYSPRVDVVELSKEVIEAAHLFDAVNGGVMTHSAVHLFQDDARGYLHFTPKSYDVIISEPSNPWMAGNAGLFSVEFFESLRAKLKKGGLLAQWFHTYEMNDQTMHIVVDSLLEVFPHVTVWEMFPNDLLFVAGEQPVPIAPAHWENLLRDEGRIASLRSGGVDSLAGLLSRQAVIDLKSKRGDETERVMTTDDRPRLEYQAPRSLYEKNQSGAMEDWSDRRWFPGKGGLLLDAFVRETEPLNPAQLEELVVLHTRFPGAS